MMRPHPRSTRTHPLVPYTTLFRSLVDDARHHPRRDHAAPAGLLRIMGVGVERLVVAHAVREIADTILGRGLDILARPGRLIEAEQRPLPIDRKSTRLNSSH